jgi:DNA (cytosine-5)-methyltransferase 1
MTRQKTTNGAPRPIGIDLFAGAGGLSLGFEQAGFDVVAAVEIDPIHCATHEFNFPQSKAICASVVDLTGDAIRQRAGLGKVDIDVVFGGAPCQGFSLIGKRALADPRNQLVFHYVRLVQELRPKYCVFENVKGLTLGKHAQFLSELIAALEGTGYSVLQPYRVLNAADFGVPQDRHRLFLIAARSDAVLPDYPRARPERVTAGEAIADLPDADSFAALSRSDEVLTRWVTQAVYAKRLRGLVADEADYSHPRKFDPHLLTSSARTEHTELSKQRFIDTEPGKTEPVSRFRKLPLDGRCNTLRAGTDSARGAFTSPRPIHPLHARVITVREAARLHSYPDWFRFHTTKWHGFRQIGNSVPPLLGRAVASEIARALGIQPVRPTEVIELGLPSLLTCDMRQAASYFEVARDVIAQRLRKPTAVGDLIDTDVALYAA